MINRLSMQPRARILDGTARRWTAHFAPYLEGENRYSIRVHQFATPVFGRYELEAEIYCNGRALPEKHRLDLRRMAIAAYSDAYGFERANDTSDGIIYRKTLPASVRSFSPDSATVQIMKQQLKSYRGV